MLCPAFAAPAFAAPASAGERSAPKAFAQLDRLNVIDAIAPTSTSTGTQSLSQRIVNFLRIFGVVGTGARRFPVSFDHSTVKHTVQGEIFHEAEDNLDSHFGRGRGHIAMTRLKQ